jgi:ribosomal protein S18 acetylase RimI-like enzyme
MQLELKPVPAHGLAETAELLNRGFADYYVRVVFDATALLHMVAHDGIDVSSSRIVLRDGKAVGAALVARRGWSSRLAGMAIVPDARRAGVGRWLMAQLIEEAQARGERRLVLEVIEQNIPAVRLYESCGFHVRRRLVSYSGSPPGPEPKPAAAETSPIELEEIDVRALARLVTMHGLPDLPWQISGESLALLGPPNRAYRLDAAYVAISDPSRAQIAVRSILVDPQARGQGQAARLLQATVAAHPGKTWRVPALCPEEIGGLFEGAGFVRESLAQLQMVLEWDH